MVVCILSLLFGLDIILDIRISIYRKYYILLIYLYKIEELYMKLKDILFEAIESRNRYLEAAKKKSSSKK
ncbi:MAG TPA: hypothetical protein PKX15_04420, partial [Bacteroidales bacterium]|nr:hypothetical protein [Bacteroidales bacterium]